MNIILILFSSLITFEGMRILFIGIYYVMCKIFKASNNMKFSLAMSIFFLLGYIQAFLGATEGVAKQRTFSNLEEYIIYTLIGISMMLWCYFSWDFKFKSFPKFGINNKQIIIKKILVFTFIMIFSFYYGYENLIKIINKKEIDIFIAITNITIVPGIIALDRVLNQIVALKKENSK